MGVLILYSIGIMQGRLTKSEGRGIQFFPFENWENEFKIASEIGLNEIEFILDEYEIEKNPLFSENGIKKIINLINEYNVKVNSVCFDYFMRKPFFTVENLEDRELNKKENFEILKKTLEASKKIGIRLIEIPLVDESSIKNKIEEDLFKDFMKEILSIREFEMISFALETDLPCQEFQEYISSFKTDRLKANYDSGNSSGLGYNHYEEIMTLNQNVANVHIKDKIFKGQTVNLGSGDVDFDGMFQALKNIKYKGSFILQVARGKDGDEIKTILSQIEFVKKYIDKYLG